MTRRLTPSCALALLMAVPAAAHDGVPHDQGLAPETMRQLHAVAEAIEPYRDFAAAERAGWKKFGGDEPLMGEHWYHPTGPDYAGADTRLDFARPSNLMYTAIGGKRVLTAVTFNVRLADGEVMPEGFAGSADRWHAHDMLRALEAALQDRPFLRWLAQGWIDANYRTKGDNRGRLAMVHVWLGVENPDGVFADHNRALPYLKLGLPAGYAAGASMDAAHGLALASPEGCRELIDGRLWIANAPARTSRALHEVCRREAAEVRSALPRPAGDLNRVAAAAWRRWQGAWKAALTPAQHARIEAMTEHGAPSARGGHRHH
ncbi:MAG: hypothetical protein ACEQR8_06745 [Cypionkella sp.]